MKILITGGYGFIGSHVAERFYEEGHEIHIIDNLSSGKKSNLLIKHKYYNMDVRDKSCEEIFSNTYFDVVIHLAAQNSTSKSVEDPFFDAQSNILGLINILSLAKDSLAKKFVFSSSSAVYGNTPQLPISESSPCHPLCPYGMSKHAGEQYCQLFSEMYGLSAVSLRFSNVYGPRQSMEGESGVIPVFIDKILKNKAVTIFGNGKQTRDFIYVEDVADAIYKVATDYTNSPVYNISTNKRISINNLIVELKMLEPSIETIFAEQREGDIPHSLLSNNKAVQELHWVPMHEIHEGLKKTYAWYQEFGNKESVSEKDKVTSDHEKNNISIYKQILPYVENVLVFLLVIFLTSTIEKSEAPILIDLKIIYIILFGVVYGLKQVTISVSLSCVLHVWQIYDRGHDLLSLLYNADTLISLAVYIFVGFVLGYSIENRKLELEFKTDEMSELKTKFDFLYSLYNESKFVRNELQEQIIRNEDSFGKIYRTIDKLNTLEPGKIFDEAIKVIEEIMRCKDVYIFSVSKGNNFLRLVSQSEDSLISLNKSIRLEDSPVFYEIIEEKTIFINRDQNKELPFMMAPIVTTHKVLGVIAIYQMEFESLTLYKKNLLSIVSNLISSAFERAYLYQSAIIKEKYIDDTAILKEQFFSALIKDKNETKKPYVLLKVLNNHWQEAHTDIPYQLEQNIREFDAMGVSQNNQLFILLSNTTKEEACFVMQRLQKIYIETELVEEVEYYGSSPINASIT